MPAGEVPVMIIAGVKITVKQLKQGQSEGFGGYLKPAFYKEGEAVLKAKRRMCCGG